MSKETSNSALTLLNAANEAKAGLEEKRSEQPNWLATVETLDWSKLPVPILTNVLSKRPFPPAGKDGPKRYLSATQAFFLALWLNENQLPISGHCWWYNFETDTPELTVEGKLYIARKQGWKLGAPKFKRVPEDLKEPLHSYYCMVPGFVVDRWEEYEGYAALSLHGFQRDGKSAKFGLWSNEGGKEHMLRIRAFDDAIKKIGYGFSEPIAEDTSETASAQEVVNNKGGKNQLVYKEEVK